MIFIPKPSKLQTDIGSLRPIFLLEIPYKIVSSIITERIKNLSKHVLTYHQNAYTSNSNIANCSRTILDFRTLSCKNNTPLAIIGFDFSSAFDCISHSFCFETMRFLGFPEDLIKNIETLINEPMISLSNNGQISDPFQQAAVGSGQGDPISTFLFCISITPLLLRLAYDPDIKRMEHTYRNSDGQDEKVISEPVGFADDIHVFLDPSDPENLHSLMGCLQEFSDISNLKLNNGKTEVLPINTPATTTSAAEEIGLKLVESIKFVGAHTINNEDQKKEHDLNFANANEKSENLMAKTEQRHVSSIGASIIFDGGRFLVTKERFFIPHQFAGLNLRLFGEFSKSLKSHWLKQMNREEAKYAQNWTAAVRCLLAKIDIKITDIKHLGYKDIKEIGRKLTPHNTFWAETFRIMSKLLRNIEDNHKDITTLPLFGGRLARDHLRRDMSIFSNNHGTTIRKWIRKKYSRIQDFVRDQDGPYRDCTKLQTSGDLPTTIRDNRELISTYRTIIAYISRITNSYKTNTDMYRDITCAIPITETTIEEHFNPKSKGCSRFYKPMLKDHIKKYNIQFPPAVQKAIDAYSMNEEDILWSPAINSVIKAVSSPKAIDLAFKIFCRQNWTPLKNSYRTRDEESAKCKLCDTRISNTVHMYINCHTAKKLWALYNKTIHHTFQVRIDITPEAVLFHQNIPGPNMRVKKAITDTMLGIKKTIQNLTFRLDAEELITTHELKAIYFNAMAETIFANKALKRLDDVYNLLYRFLTEEYGYKLKSLIF